MSGGTLLKKYVKRVTGARINNEIRLNLGCGTDIKEGYVNVDVVDLEGVEVVHNLNKFPYPFESESVDEVYLNHVLAHLESPTKTLRECHRILRRGGRVVILVPHFTSATAYWGDVRKHIFSYIALKRYEKGQKRAYYFDFGFSNVEVKFDFQKSPFYFLYNVPIEFIANRWPYAYEMTPLQSFPCRQIIATMVK